MSRIIHIESLKDQENIKYYSIKCIIIAIFTISLIIFTFFYTGNIVVGFLMITFGFVILFMLFAFTLWESPRYETHIDLKRGRICSINDMKLIKSTYIIDFNNIKNVEKMPDDFNRSIIQLNFYGLIKKARFFPRWQYKSPILIELNNPIKPMIEYKEELSSISMGPLPENKKERTVNKNPQVRSSNLFIISDNNGSIMNEYKKKKNKKGLMVRCRDQRY